MPASGSQTNALSLDSGELHHFVTILQQEVTTDVSGAATVWTVFGQAFVGIKALRGADAWRFGQFTSEKYVQIVMRWRPGILANMRIQFERAGVTRTFVVQDPIDVLERNFKLEILCVELDGR